jgi:hypothetical protein
MRNIETTICNRLVSKTLEAGHIISVYDGEEYALKRSTKKADIIKAMYSTDSDTLIIRRADGEKVGSVLLVYGNGEDVISDYSDNPEIEALVKAANQD